MKRERITLRDILIFAGVVAVFLLFEEVAGWRVVGVISLIGAVRAIKERREGFGIEGYEPSFYITGKLAVVILFFFAVPLSLFLILFPQVFIRWF